MKIAADLRSLIETGGRISGVENYSISIINLLAEKHLDIFGFYNSYKKVKLPLLNEKLPIRSTGIPNKIFNSLLKVFSFPKFEKIYGDFDILWMPDIRPFAINGKTRFVLTVHDLSARIHSEHYSIKRRIWHYFVNYKKALSRADCILVDSEYTQKDLEKLFAVDPRKIRVCHLGVDLQKFNPSIDPGLIKKTKEKFKLSDKYILSICTIEPRKNISTLIKAFEQINDRQIELAIAGRLGWLYKKILKQIDHSPKREKIKLLGYIEEDEKAPLIAGSLMLCYPSYYEGFGLVPLEAMACAVPVITSGRTSIPEVAGSAALLIEPYQLSDTVNAINALSSDQQLREKLIDKGLKLVREFSWQKTASELEKIIQSL